MGGRAPEGGTEAVRFRGRYLIACDGGASVIREKILGITMDDLGFHEPWLVVDVLVNEDKLAKLPQTQVQYCEPERPSTYVTCVGNHRRWEITLNPGDRSSGVFPDEELWPLLERWITPEDGRIWRSAAYRFHGLVANEWRRGRILLAGDAAHMTPPFMAQGMAAGMRDALNLAWKLDRVIRHGAPDQLLDTYEQERRPHVTAVTKAAIELGRGDLRTRSGSRRRTRPTAARRTGRKVKTMLRQDLIPGLNSGLIESNSPDAGSVLPQPIVRSDSFKGRLDDATGRTVRAVAVEPLLPAERATLLEALAPLDGVLVQLGSTDPDDTSVLNIIDDEDIMGAWLRQTGQRIAIARPDHYVYGTAASADEAVVLLKGLDEWLVGPRS